ncbi:MAG: FAD-dependent oxidoreductase [Candidatus Rokuibacteriota bacterium]
MIDDANRLESGQRLGADICIVGAGAAGIALALQFVGASQSVLLLESGGLTPDPATQSLYAGEVADERMHSPPDRYRQRRFGGSTTIWGGRCVPFDPIDFERRDHVPHSGWPLGYETLRPYYERANGLVEAGEFAYTVETAFAPDEARPLIAGFHSERVTTNTIERFSCPTDFGRRYAHRLRAAPNVRVLLNANVTELVAPEAGRRIASVTVRTLGGRRVSVVASHFVLAAGGLEVPRLLLASRAVHADGIGNARGLVGRFYMCHLAGTIGTLTVTAARDAVWHGYLVSPDGVYCRRRFALTPRVQRELGIGNFIARLHHPRVTDPAHRTGALSFLYLAKPFIGYEYGKRLHGGEAFSVSSWLRHARNVAADPLETFDFCFHLLRRRILAERKFPSIVVRPKENRFSVDFHSEQRPNPESRITLTDRLDPLGMPRLRVDWRHTPWDIETIDKGLRVLAEELERTGTGRLDYAPETLESEALRYGAYGGHHLGTARMGTSPTDSVVDRDCRIHDVDNLFVASSAVFPTSSQANPVLTIVALALRLADHLKALTAPRVAPRVAAADTAPPASPRTLVH